MSPEEKRLLEDTYDLVKENNHMLRKIRNVQKREGLFRFLKLLIIIGVGLGAFYFLQPYIDLTREMLNQLGSTLEQLKGVMP